MNSAGGGEPPIPNSLRIIIRSAAGSNRISLRRHGSVVSRKQLSDVEGSGWASYVIVAACLYTRSLWRDDEGQAGCRRPHLTVTFLTLQGNGNSQVAGGIVMGKSHGLAAYVAAENDYGKRSG